MSGSSVFDEPKSDSVAQERTDSSMNGEEKERFQEKPEDFIGVLDVFIHQAREIHNICIYHKQDVYAKLFLTSDPEKAASSQIINGGGKNPLFNQNVKLNVRTIDSCLKCEVWMLSRVKNYLEDQLLGFALVPLSDVLLENGKPEREFSLSSSDLFHSPAGFVQLTFTYSGSLPENLIIQKPCSIMSDLQDQNSNELNKIEFPDPQIVKEDELMVSEYFESQITEESAGSQSVPDSSVKGKTEEEYFKSQIPEESACSQSVPDSSVKGKTEEAKTAVTDCDFVEVEEEPKVVQEEIVEMYMKSMQQFTEALAKMKLPMDMKNGSGVELESGNSRKTGGETGEEKVQSSSKGNDPSPRVFYGSRAFF